MLRTKTIPLVYKPSCPQCPCSLFNPFKLWLPRRCSPWLLLLIWSVSWVQWLSNIIILLTHLVTTTLWNRSSPPPHQGDWACCSELRGHHGKFKLLRGMTIFGHKKFGTMQTSSSRELIFCQREIPLHFFDDTISLCSWIFSRYYGIKQVLCQNHVDQEILSMTVCDSKFKKLWGVQ